MPHLESKTKLIMTASVNRYINPFIKVAAWLPFWLQRYNKNAFYGLYKAGDSEASGSPWSGIEHNGKMVGKTDSIIKHSAYCSW